MTSLADSESIFGTDGFESSASLSALTNREKENLSEGQAELVFAQPIVQKTKRYFYSGIKTKKSL